MAETASISPTVTAPSELSGHWRQLLLDGILTTRHLLDTSVAEQRGQRIESTLGLGNGFISSQWPRIITLISVAGSHQMSTSKKLSHSEGSSKSDNDSQADAGHDS